MSPQKHKVEAALENREMPSGNVIRADVLRASRLACEAVSEYLRRQKHMIEVRTGMEAPPYLDALVTVADRIADEHTTAAKIAARRREEQRTARRRLILGMRERGLTDREIADRLGVSSASVRQYRRPSAIPCERCRVTSTRRRPAICVYCAIGEPRPSPEEARRLNEERVRRMHELAPKIIELAHAGLGQKAIASQLGISRSAVRGCLEKAGLRGRNRGSVPVPLAKTALGYVKRCSRCGRTLPTAEFYRVAKKDPTTTGGYYGACRSCTRERARETTHV